MLKVFRMAELKSASKEFCCRAMAVTRPRVARTARARVLAATLLALALLLCTPPARVQQQTAPPATPPAAASGAQTAQKQGESNSPAASSASNAPTASSTDAALDALAVKMAAAIVKLKARTVAVFDFDSAQDKTPLLGVKLADKFNEALERNTAAFTITGRLHPPVWMGAAIKCGGTDVHLDAAQKAGAKLAVFGKVSLEGETLTLDVEGMRVDNEKRTKTFRVQLPLTPELRELALPLQDTAGAEKTADESSTASVAKAGTKGIGFPSCAYCPRAEYSDDAVRHKISDNVVLLVLVGADGTAKDITVAKCAGYGLDEKAVEAVKNWKFKPATDADGKPVAARVPIEVDFHLGS
jgi:TonB family protein